MLQLCQGYIQDGCAEVCLNRVDLRTFDDQKLPARLFRGVLMSGSVKREAAAGLLPDEPPAKVSKTSLDANQQRAINKLPGNKDLIKDRMCVPLFWVVGNTACALSDVTVPFAAGTQEFVQHLNRFRPENQQDDELTRQTSVHPAELVCNAFAYESRAKTLNDMHDFCCEYYHLKGWPRPRRAHEEARAHAHNC